MANTFVTSYFCVGISYWKCRLQQNWQQIWRWGGPSLDCTYFSFAFLLFSPPHLRPGDHLVQRYWQIKWIIRTTHSAGDEFVIVILPCDLLWFRAIYPAIFCPSACLLWSVLVVLHLFSAASIRYKVVGTWSWLLTFHFLFTHPNAFVKWCPGTVLDLDIRRVDYNPKFVKYDYLQSTLNFKDCRVKLQDRYDWKESVDYNRD